MANDPCLCADMGNKYLAVDAGGPPSLLRLRACLGARLQQRDCPWSKL
jgi:hypothetical protein